MSRPLSPSLSREGREGRINSKALEPVPSPLVGEGRERGRILSANAPDELRKLGITSIQDDLPPGCGVDIATPFMLIFGEDLKKAVSTRGGRLSGADAIGSAGARPAPRSKRRAKVIDMRVPELPEWP